MFLALRVMQCIHHYQDRVSTWNPYTGDKNVSSGDELLQATYTRQLAGQEVEDTALACLPNYKNITNPSSGK